MVSVGKRIADFDLPATGDKNLSLSDFKGTPFVLYFYPRDNTPGCTREGQDFRDAYDRFKAAGVEVLGVSRDSVKSHENFKRKQDLPFDLLSDPDEKLCKAFDVIREKNLYGRKYMGVERSTFLVDGDGVLHHEWRKVRVPGHADAVLDAARSLA